jgi:hypothetical protein
MVVGMRRYLVVANQTLGGVHLLRTVGECVAEGACRFHLLIPATAVCRQLLWVEGDAEEVACRRLDAGLACLRAQGVAVTGEVGDADPLEAVQEVLGREEIDEIIVSTLPTGLSRWVRQDLPGRLARLTGLRVRHVVGSLEAVSARVGDEIVVERPDAQGLRKGRVLEVGADAIRPHYLVAWQDGQVSTFFPSV